MASGAFPLGRLGRDRHWLVVVTLALTVLGGSWWFVPRFPRGASEPAEPNTIALQPGPRVADDWPHWRGPRRNGHTAEDSRWDQRAWPPRQPAWVKNVGEGASAPVVVQGHVYVLGWRQGQDILWCLDVASGAEQWQMSYPSPRHGRHAVGDQDFYGGPSACPEFDTDTGILYTLSVDGDLRAWDTRQQGKSLWHYNLHDRYGLQRRPKAGRGGERRDYGYTTSPLVMGDSLLIEVGASEGNLVALDKSSGVARWHSRNRDPAGHTGGPVPITVENVPCVAVLTLYHLVVTRTDAGHPGTTIAQIPWTTTYANNIATPAVDKNIVVVTSAYNQSAICAFRVTLAGAKKLWEQPYASKVCSPIIHDGHVYWAWQRLRCLDLQTGVQCWEGGDFADPGSCILTSDNRLIVLGKRGKLALVETAARSPKAYRELAMRDRIFSAEAWPHVVLANGRLFCKDRMGNLQCYSLR